MDGKRLAQGLLNATGDDLRLVYALVMETKMLGLLMAKAQDLVNKDLNHLEVKLQQEIVRLRDVPDEELQLKLFLYLLEQLNIQGAHYNIPAEIDYACEQIVERAHALQYKDDKMYRAFTENKTYDYSALLVLYQMQKIFERLDVEQELSDEETASLVEQIDGFIQTLPAEKQQQIKDKLQIDELTNKTLTTVIATQGTAIVVALLVEVAGFAAFTTLTSIMATVAGFIGLTIPFGMYMFATSALSFLTGPVGLVLFAVGGGVLLNHQNKKMRKSLIPIGVVQLLLPAMMNEKPVHYEPFILAWQKLYDKQQQLKQRMTNTEDVRHALEKSKQTVEAQLEKSVLQLKEEQAVYAQLLQRVEAKEVAIGEEDQSPFYRQLTTQMQELTAEMKQKQAEMQINKQQPGFWNTIKSTFENNSLSNQYKVLQKAYVATKEARTKEAIQMKPFILKAECEQAAACTLQLAQLTEERADFVTRIEEKRTELLQLTKQIQQLKTELQQHQAQWYGLSHI